MTHGKPLLPAAVANPEACVCSLHFHMQDCLELLLLGLMCLEEEVFLLLHLEISYLLSLKDVKMVRNVCYSYTQPCPRQKQIRLQMKECK